LRDRIVGTVIDKAPWTSIDSETARLARASGGVATIIDPKSRTARHSHDQEKVD
jgi:hypothetical protein